MTVGGRCLGIRMSISELSAHRRGPAALLADAAGLVREAAEAMYAALSDEELIGTVELTAQLRAVAAAVEAGAVAEADNRDLGRRRLHYGSTGDWLTHLGGLRKGHGRQVVARAHALTGPLAVTHQAMTAGRVSPEQAEVIVRSIEQLPVGEAVRARGEAVLVEQAEVFDATDLARTGRHLVHVVDPNAVDRKLERALAREERGSHLTRFLTIAPDGMGGVRLKGRGSAEDGALLKAALLPLTAPAPALDEHDADPRSLQDQALQDPRDAGARMWDALVATAQHALGTTLPPDSHGAPPRLLITIGLDALTTGLADDAVTGTVGVGVTGVGVIGVGVTGDGTELSASTIRRLACDAEIIPAVLGSHSEPLDVGRTRYPVTPAIWTALTIRDRHCAFPGCDRPPVMCHAHHIRHWADRGKTKLDNLVLLCGHHHRVVHHTPWEVRINPHDAMPEFLPPPKPGIDLHWIRYRPRRD